MLCWPCTRGEENTDVCSLETGEFGGERQTQGPERSGQDQDRPEVQKISLDVPEDAIIQVIHKIEYLSLF